MKEMKKGQGLIDALFLVLSLVIVITFISSSSNFETWRAQSLRYQSQQHQQTVLAVLNDYTVLKNSSNDILLHGRIVDMLAFQLCNGCPSSTGTDYCPVLNKTIENYLRKINTQKHFIFYVANITRIYDNKPSVCLENIPVTTFTYNTSCKLKLEIIYGTWFKWMDPPSPPC